MIHYIDLDYFNSNKKVEDFCKTISNDDLLESISINCENQFEFICEIRSLIPKKTNKRRLKKFSTRLTKQLEKKLRYLGFRIKQKNSCILLAIFDVGFSSTIYLILEKGDRK